MMFRIGDRVLVKNRENKTKMKGKIVGVDFFNDITIYIVQMINKIEVRVSFYDLVAY